MAEKVKGKSRLRKIFGAIRNIAIYLFFAFCLASLAIAVMSKKDADGTVTVFGRQMRIVLSPSMEKCDATDVSGYEIKDIRVKSMVFIETVPTEEQAATEWYGKLKAGDVLTFKYVYARQETITHRITEITEKPTGGYVIKLEGDNKNSDTETLAQTIDTSLTDSPNYVVGKVTGQSYVLGLLITALKSPVGLVCIVIVPCTIIVIFEIIRIVGAVTEEKKKKQLEQQAEKDRELEELKRRLPQLSGEHEAEKTQAEDREEK